MPPLAAAHGPLNAGLGRSIDSLNVLRSLYRLATESEPAGDGVTFISHVLEASMIIECESLGLADSSLESISTLPGSGRLSIHFSAWLTWAPDEELMPQCAK